MSYIVPPACAGQIVETSYALTPYGIVRRAVDRSDRSESYALAEWTDELHSWADTRGPQSSEPAVDADDWETISEQRADALTDRDQW